MQIGVWGGFWLSAPENCCCHLPLGWQPLAPTCAGWSSGMAWWRPSTATWCLHRESLTWACWALISGSLVWSHGAISGFWRICGHSQYCMHLCGQSCHQRLSHCWARSHAWAALVSRYQSLQSQHLSTAWETSGLAIRTYLMTGQILPPSAPFCFWEWFWRLRLLSGGSVLSNRLFCWC